MSYAEIYKNLISNGYYIGKFDDFWINDNGVSKEEFDNVVIKFKEEAKLLDERSSYQHNYLDQFRQDYLKNSNYSGPMPTAEDVEPTFPYSLKQKRQKFILDAIAGGANIRTTQQWAEVNFLDKNSNTNSFNILTRNLIKKIYNLECQNEEIYLDPHYTIYQEGDFQELHFDGPREKRDCAIIFYFADAQDYNDNGARLILTKSDEFRQDFSINYSLLGKMLNENHPIFETVIPVYGNYVILDLTKNNIGHAVEIVKNNFTRYALNIFVGFPNKV